MKVRFGDGFDRLHARSPSSLRAQPLGITFALCRVPFQIQCSCIIQHLVKEVRSSLATTHVVSLCLNGDICWCCRNLRLPPFQPSSIIHPPLDPSLATVHPVLYPYSIHQPPRPTHHPSHDPRSLAHLDQPSTRLSATSI